MGKNVILCALAALPLLAMCQTTPTLSQGIGVNTNRSSNEAQGTQINYSTLRPLYEDHCLAGWEATPGTVGGAVACANYLRGLGTRECRAPSEGIIMYQSGGTIVKAFANYGDSAVSWCQDVAAAIGWVLDHCPACGGDACAVAGIAAANGNGNLIVKGFGA